MTLYEVDWSFFVSGGAANPALTIMAMSSGAPIHLLERMHARGEEPSAMVSA